ncbi:MAG: hypothetical protein ABIJ61_13195 [bacterium]
MALIRVQTAPLDNSIPCRAFYDNMESALSVGIKQSGKFYSYVEAECFSFDLTKAGKLLNIDVWKPRDEWQIEKDLHPPDDFDRENVIFLDERLKVEPATYFTNPERNLLHIRFTKGTVHRFVSPASSLIFELSKENELMGLWITNIEDDFGFKKEAIWRVTVKSVDAD